MKAKLFCIISLTLLNVLIFAQEPAYWQLSETESMPSLTIYNIIQDNTGYMWFATAGGVCRFDGRFIKRYNSSEVADNEIIALELDKWGRIWANNLNGQIILVRGDSLSVITLPPPFDKLKTSRFIISGSYLWLLNASFFRTTSFTLACFELSEEMPPKLVKSVEEPEAGRFFNTLLNADGKYYFWFLKDGHIRILEIYNNQVSTTVEFPYPSDFPIVSNHRIIPLGDNKVLIFDNQNLFLLDTQSSAIIDAFPGAGRVQKLTITSQRELFLGTTEGMRVIDFAQGKLSQTQQYFKNVTVNTTYIDREGNNWLGTSGEGVLIVPDLSIKVYNRSNSELAENEVFCISPGQEPLIGHNKGKYSSFKGGQITNTYQLKEDTRIVSIDRTDDGLIWLGSDNGLLIPGYQLVEQYGKKVTGAIKEVMADKGQVVWVASSANVSRVTYKKAGRENKEVRLVEMDIVLPQRTYALYKDFDEVCWIGSVAGLYKYIDGQIDTFKNDSLFETYRVSDIRQTADSTLWVATYGDGLLQIKNDTLVHQWNEITGFPTSIITALYTEQNDLWVGTNRGMTLIKEGEFSGYWIDNYDGLPSNEVRAIYKDANGVWIGTPKGLANFPLSVLQKNEEPPAISVTNLRINDQDTFPLESYRLQYNQNNISVSFLGFAYRARGDVTYRYRLKGLANQWLETKERSVTFFTLRPGNYQLSVEAINEDGVRSLKPANLSFTILKPWWRRLWFQFGSIILLLGLSSGVVYWRQRDLRQQEKTAQEFRDRIHNLRLEALQTQMNPHFIFNALNAIQDFLITNDREQAIHYLSSFARMIRQIFDYSRRKTVSLEEEIEFLNLYLELEKLRFGIRVDIEFVISPSLQKNISEYFLPPLLIQPIVENAFKHGLMHKTNQGNLKIFFELVDDWVKCTVEDDGVGRQKAKEFSSWRGQKRKTSGLMATKERLVIFHQNKEKQPEDVLSITDLYGQKGKPAGTKVEIYI